MRLTVSLLSAALLAGCASQQYPAAAQPVDNWPAAPSSAPLASAPQIEPAPLPVLPAITLPPPVVPAPVVARPLSDAEGRALLGKLLPARISDRAGWHTDIFNAFRHLKIPYSADNFCAALAVIEQESSWQADPVVPGLPRIVWGKIEERASGYHIPMALVRTALLKKSPTGQSYTARIDGLRTERQMNALFEDMAAEAQSLNLPMNMKNPIRTGGPMQVSVEFAQSHTQAWPYPYKDRDSVRHEVFTRRGGLYFGIAILLQYPAPYRDKLYYFADFNAGRYASRNAAFQRALGRLTGTDLDLDGDLLSYRGGVPDSNSSTFRALQQLSGRLGMSREAMINDLKQEKLSGFAKTALYQRVFQLAGPNAPREYLPQIRLNSPKITRKLTTEWFAKRVEWRYQNCLKRD